MSGFAGSGRGPSVITFPTVGMSQSPFQQNEPVANQERQAHTPNESKQKRLSVEASNKVPISFPFFSQDARFELLSGHCLDFIVPGHTILSC